MRPGPSGVPEGQEDEVEKDPVQVMRTLEEQLGVRREWKSERNDVRKLDRE